MIWRLACSTLFPYTTLFRSRVVATIYQRPEAQGRMAFEALYHFLVEGKCPPPRIKLNPHIVMRSNLELFVDRISRSEEHTSELQSRQYIVCRLLLEKKKKQT